MNINPGSTAWRCTVCGYIHAQSVPPDFCPVCGAASNEFEPYRGIEPSATPVAAVSRWQCLNCNYVHEGAEPPDSCPICGAGRAQFEAMPDAAAVSGSSAASVVIIGSGIAGVSAAETIRRTSAVASVLLIGEESEPPYYRLNLTRYLAGEITRDALRIHPPEWYRNERIELRHAHVDRIDVDGHGIVLTDGTVITYDRLILAHGSHPYVPALPGDRLDGVCTLRTATDADTLLARARSGGRCLCVGGGILGIETAGALAQQGVPVSMLESHDWLMPRQLNRTAAGVLEQHMQRLGVTVIKNARSKVVVGDQHVTGLQLEDGRLLDADVVIFTTGVRPNTALARKAGLEVNTGIIVDNHLRTSHEDIFAAGDVAEHNGQVYGAWAASQYQGSIAALNVLGIPTRFGGLPRANTVKALGLDISSVGRIQPEDGGDRLIEQVTATTYAGFIFRDGRMIGSILIGYPERAAAARKAIEDRVSFASLLLSSVTAQHVLEALT